MTDLLVHRDTLHRPGCPRLEGVDAAPAMPADIEHADRCRRCTDGTSQYQSHERGDIRNDDHLMTDGGQAGDAAHGPDEAARMADSAFATATLGTADRDDNAAHSQPAAASTAPDYADLSPLEQQVIETLVAAGGRLQSREVRIIIDRETDHSAESVQKAAGRLRDNELLGWRRSLTDARHTLWVLTDAGRAWVRQQRGGGADA